MWQKSKNKSDLILQEKRKSNDQIVRELSSIIGHDDDFETKMEMESKFGNLIASESKKVWLLQLKRTKRMSWESNFLSESMNKLILIGVLSLH